MTHDQMERCTENAYLHMDLGGDKFQFSRFLPFNEPVCGQSALILALKKQKYHPHGVS